MTDAIKKLREPAALGASAYAALSVLASVIELLFTSGGSFSDTAAGQMGNLLNFPVALAIAIAVYLANHMDPALARARLVTMVGLGTAAVAAVFGVVAFFASFGADVSGTDKFAFFLAGAGGAAAIGMAAWYAWLTWQTHAPVRPANPAPAQAPGANWGGPQVPQQQPGQAPQGQQPAGFSWTPGNANEQTAYLPPQQPAPAQSQTLQAQQSATGSYSVPPSMRPQQPGQPGPQQAQQQTQMMPPVPPTMQEYAPNPQPWQPGPGGAGAPQQQPTQQTQQQPTQQENEGQGPFGVGNWQ
ncbi:MAG TPA: hypothetical protein VL551_27255 [Actinospica sp.]|jgi:hypothetical protein|nr:hypothetical protein [Actinospica sp.]